MSRFWQYFHDRLNWLPIQKPGALSALVKGLGFELDASRADILWLREQWHPEKCEYASIPGFGKSRRLIRHSKESEPQFRQRVINAWNWHMLGGKTEGLPEILRFYGFEAMRIENLRDYQPSRWAEFQIGLKIPATQAEQQALLDDLDIFIWLVNEYKPARSVLSRIFTDTFNLNPTVWSGEKTHNGWSEGYWSRFSGVDYESPDNPTVIVSFGMAHRFQSEIYNETGAGLGIEDVTGFLAPYIDRPVWSRSEWSEPFPRNHGFTIGEIISVHWCERITSSWPWRNRWDQRKWRQNAIWDRILPKWKMRYRSWAKVHSVWSWPSDGKEAGKPVQIHGNGTFGDINAVYGRPKSIIWQGVKWGDAWGANQQKAELEILERWKLRNALQTPTLGLQRPQISGLDVYAISAKSVARRGWRGNWAKQKWLCRICPAGWQSSSQLKMAEVERQHPAAVYDAKLVTDCATVMAGKCELVSESGLMALGAPLRERGWKAGRDWRGWNETGQTLIRSNEI